jgi:hypothetical protein
MFGDFRLDLTASLLVGCVPGVYLGAKVSSRARDSLIRPVLALILLASGLRLVDLGGAQLALVIGGVAVLAGGLYLGLHLGPARPDPGAMVAARRVYWPPPSSARRYRR